MGVRDLVVAAQNRPRPSSPVFAILLRLCLCVSNNALSMTEGG